MGLEPVPFQLEHIATNRSRNHHSTQIVLDGWNGGCDLGLYRNAPNWRGTGSSPISQIIFEHDMDFSDIFIDRQTEQPTQLK